MAELRLHSTGPTGSCQIAEDIDGAFVASPGKAEDCARWRMAAVGEGFGHATAALAMAVIAVDGCY